MTGLPDNAPASDAGERIDRLITDDKAPAEALDMLDRAGIDVIVVPTDGASTDAGGG